MSKQFQNVALEGFDFFKKLLPNFEKRKLIDQCNMVKLGLEEVALPTAELMLTQFKEDNINLSKSKTMVRITNDLKKIFSRERSQSVSSAELQNGVFLLNRCLLAIQTKEAALRQYIEENFSDVVVKDGLSFKQVHVIRLVDLMNFFIRYTMDTFTLCQCEINEAYGIGDKVPFLRHQLEKYNNEYPNFLTLVGIFIAENKTFMDIIESTSDMIVSEVADSQLPAIAATNANIDHKRIGFMPIIGTAILQVRNMILAHQINVYERNKVLKQSIELRLLNLKQRQENGEQDPQIQRSIDALTSRLQKIDYDIEKFEKSAGV